MRGRIGWLIMYAVMGLCLTGLVDCGGPLYYQTYDPFTGTRTYPANFELRYCECASDFCRCPGVQLPIYVGNDPPSPSINHAYIACFGATMLPRMTTAELFASCGTH